MDKTAITANKIEQVLEDYRQGKMVIMVDDEDRENEGDLLVAAACITDDHINFMASKGTRADLPGANRGTLQSARLALNG